MLGLLNYGAVDFFVVAIISGPIFGMLLTYLIIADVPEHAMSTFQVAIIVLFGSGFWVLFQTSPHADVVGAHPAWSDIEAFSREVRRTISVTPQDDWLAWLRVAVPIGVFLLGLFLFRTDAKAERAIMVIALAAGVAAALSLLQFLLMPERLLFGPKIAYKDSLTGFFVNRNTAATFFGLAALLNTAFVLKNSSILLEHISQAFLRRSNTKMYFFNGHVVKNAAFIVAATCCYSALVLTKSRAGVASTFTAAIFLLILILFRPRCSVQKLRSSSKPRGRLFAILTAVAVITAFFFVFTGQVIWRLKAQGVDDARFCVLPGMYRAVTDALPWGTGLASFSEVFPAYRDPLCGIFGTWDMAHNFYIEGLVTFGIAFMVLSCLVVIWLLRCFVKGLRRRRSLRYISEFGIASLVLVGLHSSFDFSLQISGFAIFYGMLLAPVVTCSVRPPASRG